MKALLARAGGPGVALLGAIAIGGLREPWQWLVFGGLLLWYVSYKARLSVPGWQAPLYFSWLAVSAAVSPEPASAFPALARYVLPGFLFFWTASGEGEEGWINSVLLAGCAAAAVLLAQRAGGWNVYGFIGQNPNYTAAFCAAALAAVAAGKGGGRPARALLGLLLCGGLAASGSRGAMLAALAAVAALYAAAGRWRSLALLGAACAAGAALLPGNAISAMLKLGIARSFERPKLWETALKIAADSPLFGAGPGGFGQAFEVFKFPYFDGISYYGHSTPHAHGELFQLAAEAGFPAALFFAAVFLARLPGALRRSPAPAAMLVAVFVQGAVDVVLYSGAAGLLLWGAAGYIYKGGEAEPAGRPARALALLCLAGLAAGTFNLFPPARPGPSAFPPGSAAAAAAGRLDVLEKPKNPFAARDAGLAAAAYGDLASAELFLRRAAELEPNFAGARLDLARVYAASGRAPSACLQLKLSSREIKARVWSPYDRSLLDYDKVLAGKMEAKLCRK